MLSKRESAPKLSGHALRLAKGVGRLVCRAVRTAVPPTEHDAKIRTFSDTLQMFFRITFEKQSRPRKIFFEAGSKFTVVTIVTR